MEFWPLDVLSVFAVLSLLQIKVIITSEVRTKWQDINLHIIIIIIN